MNGPASRSLSRRRFLGLAGLGVTLPLLPGVLRAADAAAAKTLRLPAEVPPGVGNIITNALGRAPSSVNTDWFGTCLMDGLLRWEARGVAGIRPFAEAWFDYHSHQQAVSKFQGPKARVFKAGGVPISTYCAHYGLAMPCYEMATRFNDAGARQTCIDIGGIIAHEAYRNRLGLIEHDDTRAFAIPDACYFIVTPLMIAGELDEAHRVEFRALATDQLRKYIDVFLNRETGLAKTMLLADGLGKTYWTRASGWLLWAMTSVLRFLPESDPARAGFIADMKTLVDGVVRRQDASGGLHVLLDDPSTPLETTGCAMFASGMHEAMRRGWLSKDYADPVTRAWNFVRARITPEGQIVQAYTGWAGPAEQRRMVIDHQLQEWVPGFILRVSEEMTHQ
ncbi:MAG TPA: glycoside hydrolase family 88 protein [Opitutaceae bacterium]|nr:glycoside hydrolase family 88 protein [Opitutaceae bacterium]